MRGYSQWSKLKQLRVIVTARSSQREQCLGSFVHAERVYFKGRYEWYYLTHSLRKFQHPTNCQWKSHDSQAMTHLVVKFLIFHEITMSLNICTNGCLAWIWAKIVITWNEQPDDVLKKTTNVWSSSRDLMKLANVEVNLNNRPHQPDHTFQKLELFTCIPRGYIPCFSRPCILHFFIRETIVRQDLILVDMRSVQETMPNNRRVVFDGRSTRGNDAVKKRCTFHVLTAFRWWARTGPPRRTNTHAILNDLRSLARSDGFIGRWGRLWRSTAGGWSMMATPTRVHIHVILKDLNHLMIIARNTCDRLIGQGSIRDGRQYSLHRGRFRNFRFSECLWWWSWKKLCILLVKMRSKRRNAESPISAIFKFWLPVFCEEFRMRSPSWSRLNGSLGFAFRPLRALEGGREGSDLKSRWRADFRVEGANIQVVWSRGHGQWRWKVCWNKSKPRDA